jgi:ABC-2 type transport system permease protein
MAEAGMRYLKLLLIFYRNALYAEMEYRANFAVNAVMSLFWVAFAILGLRLFFFHRDHIGLWSYHQAMLVVGCYSLFSGLIEALLQPNITRIVEQVRQGSFDFVLVKPVNSQFMATLRHLSVWKLVDVLVGIGICFHALARLGTWPSPSQVAIFLALLASAAVIVYSLWVLMVTSAFWFVRIDNITELFSALFETARFPVSAYPNWLRGVLTFVIPVALVTSFPAAALIGKIGWIQVLGSGLMAAGLFCASALAWRHAVRHYSSASS